MTYAYVDRYIDSAGDVFEQYGARSGSPQLEARGWRQRPANRKRGLLHYYSLKINEWQCLLDPLRRPSNYQ